MMQDEIIDKVSILAKLELSEEEREQAKKDMEKMLGYIDKMKELDTEGVEPMSHIFPIQNVFREDIVANSNARGELMANSPEEKNGMFVVPKTFA